MIDVCVVKLLKLILFIGINDDIFYIYLYFLDTYVALFMVV